MRLDFEIALYETFLRSRPQAVEAIFELGGAYTKRGLYSKGLEMDLRLVRLEPDNPTFNYNLACSYSLLHDVDRSLESLQRAIHLGFDEVDQMRKDADLENVRRDPRFAKLVGSLRRK
jgi:tetratricopeptide (TPR) repeat protein